MSFIRRIFKIIYLSYSCILNTKKESASIEKKKKEYALAERNIDIIRE